MVAEGLIKVDIPSACKPYENAMGLFRDPTVRPFDFSRDAGRAKTLISKATICSAKMNFALLAGSKEGFIPLADANPYGDLLGRKYARAVEGLEPAKNKIHATDLSFAIFDEIFSTERLKTLTVKEVIAYRNSSAWAREAFLEHLSLLQGKQAGIGADGDYAGALKKLVETEVVPAVHTFKNKLRAIDDALVGAVAKGIIGAAGGSSLIQVFGDFSWVKLVALFGAGAAYAANALIDSILAGRAAKRECSVSYILSLDT